MSFNLDYQVNSVAPSKVGGVGAAIKYFPRSIGPSLTSGASTPNSSNPTGSLWLPVGPAVNGRLFTITAVGTYGSDSGDPSGTVDTEIYAVTGTLAAPTYTAIAGTGALTPGYAQAVPWSITASLFGDSSSGLLTGSYSYVSGAAIIAAPAVVKSVLSGLDFTNGNPALQRGAVLGFVVGVTFGTADKSNAASLTQFTIN